MKVNLSNCVRCKQEHNDLEFQQFTYPILDPEGSWTHWALCPTNKEPLIIMITIEDTGEQDDGQES